MLRVQTEKRQDWVQKLESLSFMFHSLDNSYWDESSYYQFSMEEVLKLEKATNELHEMCLFAVNYVITNNLYAKLHIDSSLIPLIERSWENEEPSVYGRFDLAFDGSNIKMLEYNADTPTSLYESAVVQWYWMQDKFPDSDQFNSIHEKLIAYWTECIHFNELEGGALYFACIKDSVEDFTTVEYLRDTAEQAGLRTEFIYMDDIGVDDETKQFLDLENREIKQIFKLYPYEWLVAEEFGKILTSQVNYSEWIEPAWKSILSNKGILAILWELYPDSEYLLPAYFKEDYKGTLDNCVVKPIYSREGANTSIILNGETVERTEGEYGEEGYIVQAYHKLFEQDGNNAVIGSWVIGQESAGICVRESNSLITNNVSRFVPHVIK